MTMQPISVAFTQHPTGRCNPNHIRKQ